MVNRSIRVGTVLGRALALALVAGVSQAAFAKSNALTVDGLKISGYLDPTYIYNQDQHVSSFFFADPNAGYHYYHSTFGDVFLDINKPLADGGSIDVQIMPTRGYGVSAA